MLNLIKIKEHADGSADYSFEYDKEFEEFYKQKTGAQVVRKENVGKFIIKMLEEAVDSTPEKSK